MTPFHIFIAVLLMAIWGFNFVVIKLGVDVIPPIFLVALRFFLTSFPALFFVKRPQTSFYLVVWYGLIMFALQFSLLFMGIKFGIQPGLTSLLLTVQVFITMILAFLFLREKPKVWQVTGALVSFTGIFLVLMKVGGELTLSGLLCIFSGACCWALGSILTKKMGTTDVLSLIVWASAVAWPPLIVASLFFEGSDEIARFFNEADVLSLSALGYITYLSTFFGFSIWIWLLSKYPLVVVAPFTLLVPCFGILSSILVLDEIFDWWKVVAALFIISGLAINVFGARLFSSKRETLLDVD